MLLSMKKRNTMFIGAFGLFITGIIFIAGCSNNTVTPTGTKVNPNVSVFDSVAVNESFDSTSFSGMDILMGRTVLRDNPVKDVQLVDNGSGMDFYLRSGDLSFDHIGVATRFALMYNDLTAAQFDTISVFAVGHDPIVATDFTSDDSRISTPPVFNVPLTTYPVYCVWLKGKHDNGTTSFNDYAIIQPREMTGTALTGSRMSWRIRVNTAGQNDFRKIIPAS